MSSRHVWTRYSASRIYTEKNEGQNGGVTLPKGVNGYYISKNYSFDVRSGTYTLENPVFGGSTELERYDAGVYRYAALNGGTANTIYSTSVTAGYGAYWALISNGDGTYFAHVRVHSNYALLKRHFSTWEVSKGSRLGYISGPSNAHYLHLFPLAATEFFNPPGSTDPPW